VEPQPIDGDPVAMPISELVTQEPDLNQEDCGPVEGPRMTAKVVLGKTTGTHHSVMQRRSPLG
jgi:hypothetical protein